MREEILNLMQYMGEQAHGRLGPDEAVLGCYVGRNEARALMVGQSDDVMCAIVYLAHKAARECPYPEQRKDVLKMICGAIMDAWKEPDDDQPKQ